MIILFFGIILVAVIGISFIRETFSEPTSNLISHLTKPTLKIEDADKTQ